MSNVRSLLDELAQNWKDQEALAASLTQRQYVRGEVAFHHGETTTATVKDTYQLVNDDPENRLDSDVGKRADTLHYRQGNLLIGIMKAQKAAGLSPNKGPEIMTAAQTGDYTKIRGA